MIPIEVATTTKCIEDRGSGTHAESVGIERLISSQHMLETSKNCQEYH